MKFAMRNPWPKAQGVYHVELPMTLDSDGTYICYVHHISHGSYVIYI